jgi:uncharacterized protein (UPF0332 family)
MTGNDRQILSEVRLDKARENLTAAENLIASGDYRVAATRTYYAVFHAMRAVLALDGIDRKHHSGVIAEFRQRYIKTGLIRREQSQTISQLSDLRTDSDYDDFFEISREDTEAALRLAEAFVKEIEAFLQK